MKKSFTKKTSKQDFFKTFWPFQETLTLLCSPKDSALSGIVIRCWINIMPAYDDVVIEPQFVLTSEAAIEAAVFIVTNNKGYINVICCLVSKGPFIYYVYTFVDILRYFRTLLDIFGLFRDFFFDTLPPPLTFSTL